ncbi:Rv1733c family protein [Streptomyces fructofermentans]|uniref:Proline rich protein membrane protein n=1 Tax=Streptomyces fructofermentans TaxID=152141 RepID=A0A918NBU5_9ACTN|nr:hypothetical protein [Streptomyces fructofermentans]GGX56306.1 hypothetical protein GCM10010515_24600 [Streptomyces fructofermentans]
MDPGTHPAQPPPDDLPRLLLWRWRRNPLRRRSDLVQAWIALGLFLAVLAAVPAAMFLAGDAAYRHHLRTARHEAATRHSTTAVLVHDAPRHPEPGSEEARQTRYPVDVRYSDAQDRTRTGRADVLPGLPAGSTVSVWTGADGRLTDPPMNGDQIRSRTMGTALAAALAVPLVAAAVYRYAGRCLERRNLARWHADWARTAPRWDAYQ